MKDFLNNELHIGDKVAYIFPSRYRKQLRFGIITKITKKDTGCWVKCVDDPKIDKPQLRYACQVYKV